MYHAATIRREDVGETMLYRGTGNIFIENAIGRVQPWDVGKRVYVVNGIVQVENEEQASRRLKNIARYTCIENV